MATDLASLLANLTGSSTNPQQRGLLVDPSFNPAGTLSSAANLSGQQYTHDTALNDIFRNTANLDSNSALQADRTKSDLTSRISQLKSQYTQGSDQTANNYAQTGMLHSGNYLRGQSELGQNFVQGVNDLNQGAQRSMENVNRQAAERKDLLEQAKMKQEKDLADSKANAGLQSAWQDSQTKAIQALIASRSDESARRDQQTSQLMQTFQQQALAQQQQHQEELTQSQLQNQANFSTMMNNFGGGNSGGNIGSVGTGQVAVPKQTVYQQNANVQFDNTHPQTAPQLGGLNPDPSVDPKGYYNPASPNYNALADPNSNPQFDPTADLSKPGAPYYAPNIYGGMFTGQSQRRQQNNVPMVLINGQLVPLTEALTAQGVA